MKIVFAILLVLGPLLPANAQQDRLYTPAQGLSNTSFYNFFQDKKGFIWIATEGGLNKFDGHDFEVYQHNPSDTGSLVANATTSVYEDAQGQLWVGSMWGLNVYHCKQNNFSVYPFFLNGRPVFTSIKSITGDKAGNIWLASMHGLIRINTRTQAQTFFNQAFAGGQWQIDDINTLAWDGEGKLWMGTNGSGLRIYDPVKQTVTQYQHQQGNANTPADNTIMALCKDHRGNMIIGTLKGGISVYLAAEQRFIQIPLSNQPDNIFNGGVYSIMEDQHGVLWVGTERNGLKTINTRNYTITDANHNIDLDNIKDTKIRCFEDRDGNLWFGVEYAGIYVKRGNSKPFHSFQKKPSLPGTISHNVVKSVLQDSYNQLWIGTDGGGLNRLRPETGKFETYTHHDRQSHTLPDNAVTALCEDSFRNVWVGTYLGGLSLFNRNTETFTTYLIDTVRTGTNRNFVSALIPEKGGNLWVGTNGSGLQYFDQHRRRLTPYPAITVQGKPVATPLYIACMLQDQDSTLWIGSYNGLFAWNRKKNTYLTFAGKHERLANDAIFSLHQDAQGDIWAGTQNGLFRVNQPDLQISHYGMPDGLPAGNVFGILEDSRQNLWASTINGLAKFERKENRFRNYYSHDGLPGNEFRPNAAFKSKEGRMYFGTTSGLVYFHPDSIRDVTNQPALVFTRLKIFNELVPVGKYKKDRSILEKAINEADTITLKYSDNNFTLEFAAIDFTAPEKVMYAYQMAGFDRKWVIRDYRQRSATYTNLTPGTYTFQIKSTNSDGIWSENTRTLTVVITPPFWKTWWAYLIYGSGLVAVIYFTRKIMLLRVKMQHELQLERLEREKLEEINQAKLQFFTNASHEFRTPLTLIIGPLEKLLHLPPDVPFRKEISLIHKNASRLLRLVNEILDLQKVEKDQIHLKPQPLNLIGFVEEIGQSFEELAHRKKITLQVDTQTTELLLWFDPDQLDKVLLNLLSNAFKFTPEGGTVTISVSEGKDTTGPPALQHFAEIRISDTGSGISQEHLDKIFERFYQIESRDSGFQLGTGIGLHLAKSLVELHKGRISVVSQVGAGSSFSIRLPLGDTHLPGEEKTNVHPFSLPQPLKDLFTSVSGLAEPTLGQPERKKSNLPRILLVEDDFDIRNYLKMDLAEQYDILEAENGQEGLLLAQQHVPDLVISDVMMPVMDGIQLCRHLKTDIHTCHIPVILLTARSSIENRIEGLETGADSYIPKPFHPRHLRIRIEKLIELRESLKQKFSHTVSFDASEMTVMSADEKFLQKAIDYVKEHMADTDLNVEEMGKQLGMSRVHLYRKLKSLTSQSPSEFVRTIRLKQGAHLLAQHKLNVSEVAYQVGFNSLQYFSNCFQEYFKMSPREYSQKCKEETLPDEI